MVDAAHLFQRHLPTPGVASIRMLWLIKRRGTAALGNGTGAAQHAHFHGVSTAEVSAQSVSVRLHVGRRVFGSFGLKGCGAIPVSL